MGAVNRRRECSSVPIPISMCLIPNMLLRCSCLSCRVERQNVLISRVLCRVHLGALISPVLGVYYGGLIWAIMALWVDIMLLNQAFQSGS